MSNDAKLERRHDYLTHAAACASFDGSTAAARRAPMYSGLKVSAAAVDDESSQDNEKHNCGGDRPPVIFAPPWVGPPTTVTRATSVFKVFVYHIAVRFVISDRLFRATVNDLSVAISSICETVLRIILVPIISFARWVVPGELIDVGLIENNPEHVFTDVVCVTEGVFHGLARRATPLNNENVTIHETCRCPGIHYWHEWRQVNQDVIVPRPKIVKKLPGRISRQNVTGMNDARAGPGGQKR